MKTWRLRIRPLSPWATPWRADSLFGALCWRWVELDPDGFRLIIEQFRDGGEPPFLLSDAWPGDLLPLPAHIPFHADAASPGKKWKPPLFVTQDQFRAIACGRQNSVPEAVGAPYAHVPRVQTAIDRGTGTAAAGQLFETECQRLAEGPQWFSVYVRSAQHLTMLLNCFRALSLTGFGKRSSTGLGAFALEGEPEHCDWMHPAPEADGFVALSHFVPAASDPVQGVWRTHVSFPKFHSNCVGNVFKGAIMMLTPGSSFRAAATRSYYGSMIPVPRPEMPGALHYGLCFAAPLVWGERE